MPLNRVVLLCVMIAASSWSGALAQFTYTAQTRRVTAAASWEPFGKGNPGGSVSYLQTAPDFSVFNGAVPGASQASSLLADRFALQGSCTALQYGLGVRAVDAVSTFDISFVLVDQTVLELTGSIVHPPSPGSADASIMLTGSDGVARYSFDGFGTPNATMSLAPGSYHFVFSTSVADGSTATPTVMYEIEGTATQCSTFQPTYPGLNGPVRVLTTWTPDGVGPQLVAGGAFTWNQGQGSQDYVAWWDGSAWANFGWGPDAPVNAMTTWDPDGSGPLPAQLIMGGDFPDVGADSTGAITVNYIARWDGVAWQPLGTGADGPVDALTTWDPDGPGPLPAVLVAAGRFTHIGGVWTGGVAYWDGVAWHSFGWGINGPGKALVVWDPDGPGPQTPQLIVGGNFTNAGAASTGPIAAHNIARWDGAAWRAMGAGLDPVTTMTVIGAQSSSPQPVAATHSAVMLWDGTAWRDQDYSFDVVPMGMIPLHVPFVPSSLAEWDPDGPGPLPACLYASGVGSYPCGVACGGGTYTFSDISRRDQAGNWVKIGAASGIGSAPLMSFDADGHGGSPSLVAGGMSTPFVLLLHSYSYPLLDALPANLSIHEGDTATFSIHSTTDSLTYAWSRFQPNDWPIRLWAPLEDGPSTTGSIVSGSHTSALTIAHASASFGANRVSDQTTYACVISDLCGRRRFVSASLTILPGSCSADYNHDGDPGTDQDIEAFFACLAGSCCPFCGSADFNGDGDVGTDADIDSFFRVLGGGPC